MFLEMLCIQYLYQEMGLVFLALPKEFLLGLEKTVMHLGAKGLAKWPSSESGGKWS